MKTVGIGIIGSGFMGKAHAWGYRNVGAVFTMPVQPVLEILADATAELAASAARNLGFARSTDNWRELISDPKISIVNITTPPQMHAEMALAALAAGKHTYLEKPMAPNAAVATQMLDAARKAGVKTQIGFNYLKNPMIALAREIVASGEIGEVVYFRGSHAEDYMADATTPWHWRLDPAVGGGVVQDLGSHIIAMARHLVGPIVEVCAQVETVVSERPVAAGSSEMRRVEVDDVARAMVSFARGCSGTLEASWVAHGRKMQIEFELVGSKGTMHFNQERFNELRLYRAGEAGNRNGFRTIMAGPEHAPYSAFCPAPGHQLGFNDLKTIEVRDFLLAVAGESVATADFKEGYEVQKTIDAILRSARERAWVAVG